MFPWKYDIIHSTRCVPRQFEYHPDYEDVVLFGGYNGDCGIINTEARTVKPLGAFGSEEGDSVLGIKWFHHHHDRFIAGSAAGIITCAKADIWDDSPETVYKLQKYPLFRKLSSVHINCDDSRLLVSGNARNVAIYDTSTGSLIAETPPIHTESINISRFSNLSPHVFATCSFDSTVKLWDARVPSTISAPVYTITTPRSLVMINFSPNDAFLLSSGVDNEVNQYLVADGRHHLRYDVPARGSDINFTRAYYSASGGYVLTGGCEESCVHLLCSSTGSMLMTVPLFPASQLPSAYVQSLRTCPKNEGKFSVLLNDKLLPYRQLIHVDFRDYLNMDDTKDRTLGPACTLGASAASPSPAPNSSGNPVETMPLPDKGGVQMPPTEIYLNEFDDMWRVRRFIDRNACFDRSWVDGVVYLDSEFVNSTEEHNGNGGGCSDEIGGVGVRSGVYGTTWISNSFSIPFHKVIAMAQCPVLYDLITRPEYVRVGPYQELHVDIGRLLRGFSRLEMDAFFVTLRYLYSTTIDIYAIVQSCQDNRNDKTLFSDFSIGQLPIDSNDCLSYLLSGHVIEFLGGIYRSATALELDDLVTHMDCIFGSIIRVQSVMHIISIATRYSRFKVLDLCLNFLAAHLELTLLFSLEVVRSAQSITLAPNFQCSQSARLTIFAAELLRAFITTEVPESLVETDFTWSVIDQSEVSDSSEALGSPQYIEAERIFGGNEDLWSKCLRRAYQVLIAHNGGENSDGASSLNTTGDNNSTRDVSHQFDATERNSPPSVRTGIADDFPSQNMNVESSDITDALIGIGSISIEDNSRITKDSVNYSDENASEATKESGPYVRSASERLDTFAVPNMFDQASLLVLNKVMLVVGGRNLDKMYYCDFLYTFFPESYKWSVTQAYGFIPALQNTFIVVPLQRTNVRHILFIVDKFGMWVVYVLDCLTMNWTVVNLIEDDSLNNRTNKRLLMHRHKCCAHPVYVADDSSGVEGTNIRCTHIVVFGGYCFDSQLTKNDALVLRLVPQEVRISRRAEPFKDLHSTSANMKLLQIGSYLDSLTRIQSSDADIGLKITRPSILGTPPAPYWGSACAMVWSGPERDPSTARMVIYGGIGAAVEPQLYCLRCGNPNLLIWETVDTAGQFPGIRYGHCMVSASHNTLLVHGGLQVNEQFRFVSPRSESIFVLHFEGMAIDSTCFRWSELVRRCPVSITSRCRHSALYWEREREDRSIVSSLLIYGGVDTEEGMYNEHSLEGEEGVQEIWLGDSTWSVGTYSSCDEQKVLLINCNPRLLRKPYSMHSKMKNLLNQLSHFDIAIKFNAERASVDMGQLTSTISGEDSEVKEVTASSAFPAHSVIISLRCPMLAAALNFPVLSSTSGRSSDLVTQGEDENDNEAEAEFLFHKYPSELQTLEVVSGEILIELGDVDRLGGAKNLGALINYLYCGTAELTPESVMFYLHTADQYSMRSLQVVCENYLIRYLDPTNVCHILSISEPYLEQLSIMKAVAIHMIVAAMEQGSIREAELTVLSGAIRRDIDFLQMRRAESRRRRGQI